ncbi:hypothetical protein RF11_07105 [Thelohanellus kitauei]|uniref:Uncharacterized protein n=1 Tax=Thelohanellus kitauei TaxID=669202 RepID=A0A0C2J1P3_THEKT|nr:hypothetical protein RF11_07105 [Thelohanellus kitauei]
MYSLVKVPVVNPESPCAVVFGGRVIGALHGLELGRIPPAFGISAVIFFVSNFIGGGNLRHGPTTVSEFPVLILCLAKVVRPKCQRSLEKLLSNSVITLVSASSSDISIFDHGVALPLHMYCRRYYL